MVAIQYEDKLCACVLKCMVQIPRLGMHILLPGNITDTQFLCHPFQGIVPFPRIHSLFGMIPFGDSAAVVQYININLAFWGGNLRTAKGRGSFASSRCL